jgi:hypothetical protein
LRIVLPHRWQTTENMDAGNVRRVVMLKPSKDVCVRCQTCVAANARRVVAPVRGNEVPRQQSFVFSSRAACAPAGNDYPTMVQPLSDVNCLSHLFRADNLSDYTICVSPRRVWRVDRSVRRMALMSM